MRRRHVDLLYHCRLVRRRNETQITARAQCRSARAGKPERDQAEFARGVERGEDVGRCARRGQRNEHVAAPAEPAHLALEHAVERIVVADRGEHRRIGQGDCRPRRALAREPRQQLGRDVLCVGRAPAVAGDQDLAAGAQGARDRIHHGEHRSMQRAVARHAAERLERAVEIGRNGILTFGHVGLRAKRVSVDLRVPVGEEVLAYWDAKIH